jgi:hypothetical protein
MATNYTAGAETMSKQYWQVYYQTGMCGGSFTCDAENEAVAMAQALTKARHFKGAAVVHYPADCETMFDALIVMEIGSEDVIPCRPHGITFEAEAANLWVMRDDEIVASVTLADLVSGGCGSEAARFDGWFDHTGGEIAHHWWGAIRSRSLRRRGGS